jgi:hypothetical protein
MRYAVRLRNEAARCDAGLYVVTAGSVGAAKDKAAAIAARQTRAEARAQGILEQFVRSVTAADYMAVTVEPVMN